ncbi:VOC family protein [Spongiibacter taiwanensis]|uniref:VOC family protein n=1 Tax=Spongiibacter taiwanensis TaxID=1748242 RepID=UPI002034C954|nr:VOC family protein [Spongiibacter taiwanensis]USA42651.1 VOC family protein [Spongiibacter taiwanensis]
MSTPAQYIRPAYMAHLVIQTRRYQEMINWYATVFQTEPVFESDKLTFVTYDDEHHRFAFLNLPPQCPEDKNPMAPGIAHTAYSYASMNDLVQTYARLKGEGILPRWCINHGITTSFYYADPDGNELEFQYDNFRTPEACKAYFSSEAYFSNPIGKPFEPNVLLSCFEEGMSEADMLAAAEEAADPNALPVV